MKSSFWKLLFAATAALAVQPIIATSTQAAITITGATLVFAADPSDDPNSFADTIGGNDRWNIYIRPQGAADFLNFGDGAESRFETTLNLGDTATWEIYVNSGSWADNVAGSYLNLFVGDRSTPAISVRLTAGNTGALAPLTSALLPTVPNDATGALVAPAGTGVYVSGEDALQVTGLSMESVPDTVSSFDDLPDFAGAGAPDSRFTVDVAVVVVPEPATGFLSLLGASLLLLRRRRSR